jgi:hypothetical protein
MTETQNLTPPTGGSTSSHGAFHVRDIWSDYFVPQKAAMKSVAVAVERAVRVETMAVACEARPGCPGVRDS